MSCKHDGKLHKINRITTGNCYTEGWCGCTGFCKQPAGLTNYICLQCGKNVYIDERIKEAVEELKRIINENNENERKLTERYKLSD